MKFGDPKDLKLTDELIKSVKILIDINITKILGPHDSFKFSCKRDNKCCRNRTDNPIILNPYDVLRLSRNRNLSTTQLLNKYTTLTLGGQSHLPLALLKYEGNEFKNKCPFLRSYGCSVYPDRPLRCRLYPLGRIIIEDKSYFILQETSTYCNVGHGESHTVIDWIEESGLEEYFNLGEDYSYLQGVDFDKYKALSEEVKHALIIIMYDVDRSLLMIREEQRPTTTIDIMKVTTNLIKAFFKAVEVTKE